MLFTYPEGLRPELFCGCKCSWAYRPMIAAFGRNYGKPKPRFYPAAANFPGLRPRFYRPAAANFPGLRPMFGGLRPHFFGPPARVLRPAAAFFLGLRPEFSGLRPQFFRASGPSFAACGRSFLGPTALFLSACGRILLSGLRPDDFFIVHLRCGSIEKMPIFCIAL